MVAFAYCLAAVSMVNCREGQSKQSTVVFLKSGNLKLGEPKQPGFIGQRIRKKYPQRDMQRGLLKYLAEY
jgi:hypothetical protein